MQETLRIGAHEFTVYGQRIGYITNKVTKQLAAAFEGFAGLDIEDPSDLLQFLGGSAYDIIAALSPNYGRMCPRWEFLGFASQEALDNGEYDEAHDKGPTNEEIENALRTLARVNRFDVLKIIGKVIDPKLIRVLINEKLMEFMESKMLSGNSAIEPSTTGGSEGSTSSGTTPPISTASEESRTSGLTGSSSPEPAAA